MQPTCHHHVLRDTVCQGLLVRCSAYMRLAMLLVSGGIFLAGGAAAKHRPQLFTPPFDDALIQASEGRERRDRRWRLPQWLLVDKSETVESRPA